MDIYQERRAGEICESILIELRSFLPIPNEKSPYAIGATPEGDDYRIANRMAELILRELGWNAISLGTSLPFSTIEKAVIRYEPKLIWLSISSISNKKKFFVAYQQMRERAGDNYFLKSAFLSVVIAIILGGNALTERVRKEIPCTAYCEHMQDMESYVANIFKN